MINALSFDVEDWFQVENLKSVVAYDDWDQQELRVVANTEKILRVLKSANTKATFFILGWVAERCEGLMMEIKNQGHEIASHGYSHELVYNMGEEAFDEDIRKSKEILEGFSKKPVIGYRAPSFSITNDSLWALDVLKKNGIKYDSSIFPVNFHDRYGYPMKDSTPFRWPNGLIEIPLSVYRLSKFNLPVAGGGYFRLLPYAYFKFFLQRLNRNKEVCTFYLHPWELDPDQPKVSLPLNYRFRHYVNLKATENRLANLLRDFKFDRMSVAHDIIRDVM